MPVVLTGDKELDRKLAALSAGAENKIMRPAVAAGLRVAARAMKAAVPANMKDARKAIGSRFGKGRAGTIIAKAGAGVGMKAAKIAKQVARQKEKRAGRPGVGIGARNIMWFILGTKWRKTASGKSTGAMAPQMNPIKAGFQSSESAVMAKIAESARAALERLARS